MWILWPVSLGQKNAKRVHVHLMVHERTMATAEGTLVLRIAETVQGQATTQVNDSECVCVGGWGV